MEKRNICLVVSGGLGDQVCAEPVIRWMINNHQKNDNIVVMSQHPEIFSHLPVKVFNEPITFDRQYLSTETHPKECPYLNFHRIHPVDYVSLLLFKRTLNIKDKSINLKYPDRCVGEVKLLCGGLDKSVVIHPGISWESKTIPEDFWIKAINALEKKYKIIVIGKEEPIRHDKSSYTGVLNFKLDNKHCDLRGKLTTEQLFCLLDLSPVLITNDSGPLHVAGAFDNYIGLIPTCKHPDYLLPFRNGAQNYKSSVLWKSDVSINYDFDPMTWHDVPLHEKKFNWDEALPDTATVMEFVENCFFEINKGKK